MALAKILLFFILSLMLAASAAADSEKKLIQQRTLFTAAQKALQSDQITRFEALKKQLDDYPLVPYLDYLYFLHHLNQVSSRQISRFLKNNDDTFYSQRLRVAWLKNLSNKHDWKQYLKAYREPQSASLQCLRLQALLATGHTAQAFADTPALWLVPRSQDKDCDPVFALWQRHGLLTDKLRHQRMMMALRHNQFSLAGYLAKGTTDHNENSAWVKYWQEIHQSPLKLLEQLPASAPSHQAASLTQDKAIAREIIMHGITQLAKYDPDQAYSNWLRIKSAYHFSELDRENMRRTIGRWAALNRNPNALRYFGHVPNDPWRIRAALWQQNWKAVKAAINSLDKNERQSTRWQYWLGRTEAELGHKEIATHIFASLSKQRDFYGFLSADHLHQKYQMNHDPIDYRPADLKKLMALPAVQRLREFYILDMQLEARRQAYQLSQTLSNEQLQLLAVLTNQWGWHNQTIALLGQARYWDALDLRFPLLFDNAILTASKTSGLDPSWLLAIARQESAFNTHARSNAGAMGLMQLLPKTGKLIGRLINRPLKHVLELLDPDKNIELGSAYLRRMYDQNDHNPVLATASYNAGPQRVQTWLPEHQLPADIWIENIPYNETRRYVRSVMSYAAIFDYQQNKPIKPITDRMPAIPPKTP